MTELMLGWASGNMTFYVINKTKMSDFPLTHFVKIKL